MAEPQADGPREIETALVVWDADPAGVLERIARLSTLTGQHLDHLPAQEIKDTYYDTSERSLGAQRIALRTREVDASVLLTLKADADLRDDVSDRFELEAPWSRGVLQTAQRELTQRGIELREADGAAADDPQQMLSAMGLMPIQRRATQRTRRVVRSPDGTALAEIALDAVTYVEPPPELRLYEVEIERRAPRADVRALAHSLVAAFPSLHPWRYGKLSTGLVAAAATAAGRLEPAADGTLDPDALERLERELARDG